MSTDISKLTTHHKNLHDFYVKVATTWPASDPQRAPILELISETLEIVESQMKQVSH